VLKPGTLSPSSGAARPINRAISSTLVKPRPSRSALYFGTRWRRCQWRGYATSRSIESRLQSAARFGLHDGEEITGIRTTIEFSLLFADQLALIARCPDRQSSATTGIRIASPTQLCHQGARCHRGSLRLSSQFNSVCFFRRYHKRKAKNASANSQTSPLINEPNSQVTRGARGAECR